MPTQLISGANLPDSIASVDEDMYIKPTQEIQQNKNVSSKLAEVEICDIATERPSENYNVRETESDDDIYLTATQPINIDSQFKVPKSFTFKKKSTAILEKSLNTLLGDNDKDDDIFNAATQKIPDLLDVQNSSDTTTKNIASSCEAEVPEDVYDAPTQAIVVSDDIYLQPTQYIEPYTDIMDLSSKTTVTENNKGTLVYCIICFPFLH